MKEEKQNENLPEVQETKSNEVAKNNNGVKSFDLTGNLPNLNAETAAILPIDLMPDYWTPESIGEQKRVFFIEIKPLKVLDQQTGELIELECAQFVEQTVKGDLIPLSNGSKRLVGALEANMIQKGTPLLITYMGKKKNKSNGFSSDNWSVKPLIIQG